MTVVVSDTTPLNYLILIEQVEVLPRLFGSLLLPSAVVSEMQHSKAPLPVSAWAKNPPAWAQVRTPKTDLGLAIGRGESEAISLALEFPDSVLLVDDRKARTEAEQRGLTTIGTITVLDLADDLGFLDFEAALARLRSTNFHIESSLLEPVRIKIRARKSQSG